MNSKRKFIKILALYFCLGICLLVILEFGLAKFYLRNINNNIENKRKIEFRSNLKQFIKQKEQEYSTMVKGYAWWTEMAKAFTKNDDDYLIDECFSGDKVLTNNYQSFLILNQKFKMIFGISNGISSIKDSLAIEKSRNIKLEKQFFNLTAKNYKQIKNKYKDYDKNVYEFDSDIENDQIWHIFENYNNEVQLLTITPICSNWGYPVAKGFFLFGNSLIKILKQAEKIIPAKFKILKLPPPNTYTILEINREFTKKKIYIEIIPNLKVKSITNRSIIALIIIQSFLLLLILIIVAPLITKRYAKTLERRIKEQTISLNNTNKELENKNSELTIALDEIKTIKGLVPICSNCHNIRDDDGYWNKLENYISAHTDAKFSHSLCPLCIKKLYPEIYKTLQEKKKKEKIDKKKIKIDFLTKSREFKNK